MDFLYKTLPFLADNTKFELIDNIIRVATFLSKVEERVETSLNLHLSHTPHRDVFVVATLVAAKPNIISCLDEQSAKIAIINRSIFFVNELHVLDTSDFVKNWKDEHDVNLNNWKVVQFMITSVLVRLFINKPTKFDKALFEA